MPSRARHIPDRFRCRYIRTPGSLPCTRGPRPRCCSRPRRPSSDSLASTAERRGYGGRGRAFVSFKHSISGISRCLFHSFLSDKRRFGEEGRNRDFFYIGTVRNHVEDGRDQLLEYTPQAAGARLVFDRKVRDLIEYLGLDCQLDTLILEDLAELLVDRIFRLDHDPHQHLFAEVLKTGDDGEPASELRDQLEGKQVGRLYARVEPVQHLLALALLDRDIPVGVR